jgi:hypothetical protein
VYAGDAIVAGLERGQGLTVSGSIWMAAVVLVWAPLVVLAVTSPVRWIESQMRADGARSTAVADDPELTFIERVSLRIAAVGWFAAIVAMALTVTDDAATAGRSAAGVVILAASVVAVSVAAFMGRFRSLATIS